MRRSRPLLALACVLLGFLAITATRSRPADPETRLPRRYQLAALIERQQRTAATLRSEVAQLRGQVDDLVRASSTRQGTTASREQALTRASLDAGLVPMRGAGLRVTLDDSLLDEAPSGDVNDLVVHSQDVQAVVNALWRAGAEAMAINGQRLVGTSAVLCVGNTLLLNGTVHSPPYVVSAVGASRDRFDADPLVRRLRQEAQAYGVRVSIQRADQIEIPKYRGSFALRYARPAD